MTSTSPLGPMTARVQEDVRAGFEAILRPIATKPKKTGSSNYFDGARTYLDEYLVWIQGPVPGVTSAPWPEWLSLLRDKLATGELDVAAQQAQRMLDSRDPIAVTRSQRIGELTESIRTKLKPA